MSASPTKETILGHPPSPLSSQAHFSPRLLTPDSDHLARQPDTGLTFAKQPINAPRKLHEATSFLSSPFTESEASDGHTSESHTTAGSRPHSPVKHHLSLLTAILSSPDGGSKPPGQAMRNITGHSLSGMISGSSGPSTTMSSPATREPHGILQNTQVKPAPTEINLHPSILRRESMATGEDQNAMGLGLGPAVGVAGRMESDARHSGLDGLVGRLEKVEEKRERIGWADKVDKVTPSFANLARIPSTNSSCGPCRPRLQFAVAHPPSHGSTSASEAGDIPSCRRSSVTTSSSHHPNDPFAKERKVQESLDERSSDEQPFDDDEEDEEEEEEDDDDADATPLEEVPRLRGYNSRSTSSSGRRSEELYSPIDEEDDEDDLGYQEDEEDGMFSDEEETTAFDLPGDIAKRKFAFARPTNYFRGRRPSRSDDLSPATTPPQMPAPSYFPPPNRRGRGHVRVADPIPTTLNAVEKVERKGCTRHCSPPPSSRSRSGSKGEIGLPPAPLAIASPSARFMKRPEVAVAVAGPSKPRIVGSPMPPRVFADEEDEDDEEVDEAEEEEEEEAEDIGKGGDTYTPPPPRGGWRSDDSVFYGLNARVPSRAYDQPDQKLRPTPVHTNRPVFEEESGDDHSVSASMAREASMEGIPQRFSSRRASEAPILRRPSNASPPDIRIDSGIPIGRPREVSFSSTVPPALDSTPVLAVASSFTKEGSISEFGGLASRLEQTLSANSSTPSSNTGSVAPAMSRDTTTSSATSIAPPSTIGSRPSSRPVSSGRDTSAEPLNRAVSMSGRVTFRPTEKPQRVAIPQRAVSHAAHHLGGGQREKIAVSAIQAPAPIKCPKRARGPGEDLGWSDEALISIRRKAGKGVMES